MILSEKHRQSILQWIADSGLSKRAAARELNIAQSAFLRWVGDEDINIHDSKWKVLQPKIQQYLEPTPSEKTIPDKLKKSYEALKTISTNKSLLWVTEQYLRNTASIIEENAFPEKENFKEPEPTVKFEVPESSLPYLRQQVAAGNGVAIVEERFHDRPDMHFMDVSGESMLPTYKDGQKILVQLFQQRVTFGENHIPMEVIKAMIPENTVIIYERNDEGIAMKRVKYEKGSGRDAWYLKLTADNTDWAKEVKFKRIIRKTDNFVIYGKVLS